MRTPMTESERRERRELRAQRNREAEARALRMIEHLAAQRAIVATGKCPLCGGALRRNWSLPGWWQCEQHGAPSFRARPEAPPCAWQTFTE